MSIEEEMLERCLLNDPGEEELWERLDACQDEFLEEYADFDTGLDLMVITATLALNAAGCPTRMSCNGHGRQLAYVDFWIRSPNVARVCGAANRSGIGLCNCDSGGLIAETDEPMGFLRFARELRTKPH